MTVFPVKAALPLENLKGVLPYNLPAFVQNGAKGIDSEGMILAASNDSDLSILTVDKEIADGTIVS